MASQFGTKPSKEDLRKYSSSDHWKDGSFKNLVETSATPSLVKIPGMIYKQVKNKKQGAPVKSLPIKKIDRTEFEKGKAAKYIWYGHSVLLLRMAGLNILIDPMFGPDASPIAPFATKRFSENTLDIIDELPEIDLMLMTHDHYDHLDLESIKRLGPKVKKYFVALGVKRHLSGWGVDEDLISEFDWWDNMVFNDIRIHFTPSRHFSGRGLKDRAKCLWGGWVFETSEEKIWFSGDGGYGGHFKEIGERLGPFDIGFMECGQYCDDWAEIHMFPNEAVQAAKDAGAVHIIPVHWGGFNLSYFHHWYEPVEDFVKHAKESGIRFSTPKLGEPCQIDQVSASSWWEEYKSE